MLLSIESLTFYTFMYLGTKCPDCEIRNADFAEVDLIGISVHLHFSVLVQLPEGIEVLQVRSIICLFDLPFSNFISFVLPSAVFQDQVPFRLCTIHLLPLTIVGSVVSGAICELFSVSWS